MKYVISFALLVFGLFCLTLEAWSQAAVHISEIKAFDEGSFDSSSSGSLSIDVVQDTCSTQSNGEPVLEDFFDTFLKISVRNDTYSDVTIQKFSYTIPRANASKAYKSRPIAPASSSIVLRGETSDLLFHFLKIHGARKYFSRPEVAISEDLGFKNITVTLQGRTSAGRQFKIRARTALSFGNFNRCETQ